MNQASLYVSHCGVGLFHKFFPPVNSIGINPNPTPSNPREIKANFLGTFRASSKKGIPSLLASPLAYNVRGFASSYLTTISRGNISPLTFDAPADNNSITMFYYDNGERPLHFVWNLTNGVI